MTILRGKLGNFREKLGKCKLEGGGGRIKKHLAETTGHDELRRRRPHPGVVPLGFELGDLLLLLQQLLPAGVQLLGQRGKLLKREEIKRSGVRITQRSATAPHGDATQHIKQNSMAVSTG